MKMKILKFPQLVMKTDRENDDCLMIAKKISLHAIHQMSIKLNPNRLDQCSD